MDNRKNGFTLIELLVAITVLAIVAVLGWRGLDTIVRARVALTQDLEQTRGIQLAFAQMQSDCARIVQPADLRGSATFGNATLMSDRERVTIVRTVFAENQPSRMQVVAYRLRDGRLTRYESDATRDLSELESMWKDALDETKTEQGVLLQSDVAAITVESLFRNPSGPGITTTPPSSTQSGSTQPGTVQPGGTPGSTVMPVGLQVALKLRGHDNEMIKIFLVGAV